MKPFFGKSLCSFDINFFKYSIPSSVWKYVSKNISKSERSFLCEAVIISLESILPLSSASAITTTDEFDGNLDLLDFTTDWSHSYKYGGKETDVLITFPDDSTSSVIDTELERILYISFMIPL